MFRARGNRGRSSFTQTGQPAGLPRGHIFSTDTITQHSRAPITGRVQPHSPACSNLVPCRNSQPAQGKKIEIFSKELEKTNHRPNNVGEQAKPPRPIVMSNEETKLVDQEIQEMLRKGAITVTEIWKISF